MALVLAGGDGTRLEPLTRLITGRYPVDAYRDLLLGPARGIKNVLAFG